MAHDALTILDPFCNTTATMPDASRATTAPMIQHMAKYESDVMTIAISVPFGTADEASFRSPERLAPARIPVDAGKNIANTEKKSLPPLYAGTKFSLKSVEL